MRVSPARIGGVIFFSCVRAFRSIKGEKTIMFYAPRGEEDSFSLFLRIRTVLRVFLSLKKKNNLIFRFEGEIEVLAEVPPWFVQIFFFKIERIFSFLF